MATMLTSLIEAQKLARAGVLFAPVTFLNASHQQLKETCNGCGAADSWFRPPATIYGTNIVYACHIHDWMYSEGRTIEDKDEADRSMFNNMNRLIRRDADKWYKPTSLQHRRALKYYLAVKDFGGSAFWAGKN